MKAVSFPRAVLFDWDNTLIDSWSLIGHAMNETLKAFGQKPWTNNEVEARARASMRDSFPALFGAEWQEAARYYTESYAAIHLDHLRPLTGAEGLLRRLHEKGTYCAIVSNKRGHFLRAESEILGWNRFLHTLVGAGDSEKDKPAPEHAFAALAPSGSLDVSNVWFVGDTDIDLRCGHNIGAIPILVRPQAPQAEEFQGIEPFLAFSDCSALEEYLITLDV